MRDARVELLRRRDWRRSPPGRGRAASRVARAATATPRDEVAGECAQGRLRAGRPCRRNSARPARARRPRAGRSRRACVALKPTSAMASTVASISWRRRASSLSTRRMRIGRAGERGEGVGIRRQYFERSISQAARDPVSRPAPGSRRIRAHIPGGSESVSGVIDGFVWPPNSLIMIDRMVTKKTGVRNRPRQGHAGHAEDHGGADRLAHFRARPVAIASGITPRMKAKDVIRIGRRRSRHASTAACDRRVAMLLALPWRIRRSGWRSWRPGRSAR